MSPAAKRGLGFALLLTWGIGYLLLFAYFKLHSRSFLLEKRMHEICSVERCDRFTLPTQLDLTDLSTRPSALLQGWAPPEVGGVWVVAHEAHLYLPLPIDVSFPIRVRLTVQAAISDAVPSQQLVVRGRNGSEIARAKFTQDASGGVVDFTVEPSEIDNRGGLALHLELPDAWVPAKHSDSPDRRLLGVLLQQIELSTGTQSAADS